jgi:hypothetical protein
MKKTNVTFLTSLFLMWSIFCLGQVNTSTSCSNSSLVSLSDSIPIRVSQTSNDGWLRFVATSKNPIIKIKNLMLGKGGKITNAIAYKGRCNNLTILETDTINTNNDTVFVMDLNSINVGDSIFIYTRKGFFSQQCNNTGGTICSQDADFEIGLYRLKSIFSHLNNISQANLNSAQLVKFNKIRGQNIYSSINFIRVEDIRKIAAYGKLKISLPFLYCNNVRLKMSSSEYNEENNFKWSGKSFIDNDSVCTYGNLLLIKNNGVYIGHLTSETRSYEIFDLTGGIQVICETNLSLPRISADCASKINGSSSGNSSATGPCADGKSKVLILYTPAANSAESDMPGRANLCIADINQIWANSNIYNNLTIASIQPFNFTESSSITADVNSLASNTTVQSLRNLYQAEIVVLFTNGGYTEAVGVVKAVGGGFADAYAIVEVIHSTTGRHTFAHEVSHLFAARHEKASDNSSGNGHGYFFKTGTGWFGWGGVKRKTLMHTLATNESRIEHVSNPSVNFMNVPTGTSQENNAGEVNAFKTQVGSFYPDPIPATFNFQVIKAGCGNNWWGYAEICNGTPYTYNWFASPNGFFWIPVGSGYVTLVNIPWSNALLKCEVRNASNALIYTLQKNTVKFGMCGGAAFRQNNSGEMIESPKNDILLGATLTNIPNPNDGNFNVELLSMYAESDVKIVLSDVTGKIVKEIYYGNILAGKQNFKVDNNSDISPGIYFIKVNGKKLNLVNKIIIQ